MRKKEILLIVLLCLLCALALGAYYLSAQGKAASGAINVYVDGKLYCTQPLQAGKSITISQEDGSTNVIRMLANGFYMESSTCYNQVCIHQGEVTVDNWRTRVLGTQVLCLPNRVTAELAVEDASSAQDAPDI